MASHPPTGTRQLFFGRAAERQRLRSSLDRLLEGSGSLVLVSGEAGIGKTTLMHDIASTAVEFGALVLAGHCYDLSTTPPYGPWLEIVRSSPHIEGLPSLSEITSGAYSDDASPGRGDELFAWGRKLFGKLAEQRPLVLALEDIHWADRASLDFLRFLGRSAFEIPALLIATYRADEIEPGHPLYALLPAIVRESQPDRIDLQPLDKNATAEWVYASYALPTADGQRLTAYLQQHAEGNPFFAGEILRELETTSALYRTEDVWSLGDLEDIGVPGLLRQVLEARLGRVSSDTREALALAAIIGQDVDIDVWRGLADLTDDEALGIADQASRTALVDLSSDGCRLAFRHALIRETLYQEILPPRRRILHLHVAEALLDTDEPDPDAVAHHLQRAGDSRAAEWLINAGDRAYYQAYSLQTAVARYESALEMLPDDKLEERGWLFVQLAQAVRYLDPRAGVRYADEAVQISANLEDRPLGAVALRNRGICRVYAGESALNDLVGGYDLIDELTEAEWQMLQNKRQGKRINTALGRQQMALWYATMGRFEDAIETNRRSFAMLDADAPASGSHAAILHWGAGLTYASLGDPVRGARAFRRSHDAFKVTRQDFHAGNVAVYEFKYITLRYFTDDLDQRALKEAELLAFGQNDLARVTNDPPDVFLSQLYLITGQWGELRRIELEMRHLTRSVLFFFATQTVLAEFFRRIGCAEEVLEYVRDCFPCGPDIDPEDSEYRFDEALELQRIAADLALDRGQPDEALPWIERRRQWLDWSGRVLGQAEQSILEARYDILTSRLERARDHAIEAVQQAENPRQPLALLQAHLVFGEVLTRLGNCGEAKESLQRALKLADACQAPYERGLVQMALAELHMATEDLEAASKELRDARGTFARLGAEPTLRRATALQGRLRKPSGQSDANTAGLSDREIEVLHLVADGLTDREIGEQLFISPRTVGQHMRSIFNKFGVNSRTAAAIKATETELLQRSNT